MFHPAAAGPRFLSCLPACPSALPLGARQLLLIVVGEREDAEERVHALLGRHTWQRCGGCGEIGWAAGDETQPADVLFAFFSFSMPRINNGWG